MYLGHVGVALITGLEVLHTKPANMRRALPAFYMIAPVTLLNWTLAIWTVSDIIFLLPFPERFPTFRAQILVLLASHPVMCDNVACRTDRREASGAKEPCACDSDAVHLRTIRRWAMLEVFRMRANICIKRPLEEFFESRVVEHCLQFIETEY